MACAIGVRLIFNPDFHDVRNENQVISNQEINYNQMRQKDAKIWHKNPFHFEN